MKQYQSVYVVGSIAYDEIMNFPSLFSKHFDPDKLRNINVSFVVDKLEKQLGGTATNIAYNLSLLQVPSISILAGIGKDGQDFLRFFEDHQIKIEGIYRDDSLYTATGKVITDMDGNQIWGFYYGACESGKHIRILDFVTPDDVLILSATHVEQFIGTQNQAIEAGIDYLYDPGMALSFLSREDLIRGVKHARWLVGNDYEISHLLAMIGRQKEEIIEGGTAVITTFGKGGAEYTDKDSTYTIPAYPVDTIVDPTGAGDAWRAGFVFGILAQEDVSHCVATGNALASFAVEQYGTVNHSPSYSDIEARAAALIP